MFKKKIDINEFIIHKVGKNPNKIKIISGFWVSNYYIDNRRCEIWSKKDKWWVECPQKLLRVSSVIKKYKERNGIL